MKQHWQTLTTRVLAMSPRERLLIALTGIAFAAQNRLGEGYKASSYKASTRVVAKVSAESPAARKENADTNSILKALK